MSASSKKKLRKEQEAAGLTEKQLSEKKEARKVRAYTITFVVVMVLVVLIALGVGVGQKINASGILDRNTTAVTIGEHKLTSAELSYYYIDAINATLTSWQQSYGSYFSYYLQMFYGLDLTQPLSDQVYNPETGASWADYFVETAISNAKSTYTLCDEAAANGYVLTEEEEASVDTALENMRLYAVTRYGYSDLTAYLKAMYGYGSAEDTFREYCLATTLATSYETSYNDSLTYDDETIRAYDAEHALEYNSYSFTSYYLASSSFLKGGTTDEDGKTTYSDEEIALSVSLAESAANSLLESETIEDCDSAFDSLLIADDDTASSTTKYEDRLYSSISTTFQEWVSDPNRQAGDKTVIPRTSTSTDEDGNETTTTNGYYVLFFEGCTDNITPLVNVRHILVSFEGGTTNQTTGTTIYSDEEKQTALEKAEALLAQWESGDATEDSFAELANENSTDTGSNTNGGLYEDVYPGQMVTNFNDWCFDESRQPGDTGIVESDYGYHVMYYVSDSDTNYRDYMITAKLRSDEMTEWYSALLDAVTVTTGNTSRLNRDLVLSTTSAS